MGQFALGVLAAAWGLSATAATPSVNGANVFAQPSIIDAQGSTWSIAAGVIEKNGVHVGNNYNVNLLLEYNQVFYHRNTSDDWYKWNGARWVPTADPRVAAASGTRIGVGAAALVDSQQHVWALPSEQSIYQDGSRADAADTFIALLYYKSVVYYENANDVWYSWNGSSWTRVAGDPTTSNPTVVSANGASIGVGTSTLVDSAGNVWTLLGNEYAYVNGKRAAGNYNTVLLLYSAAVVYSENTSGQWYAWTGAAWKQVGGDPRGPNLAQYVTYTSPVCAASEPNCTPAFVNDSSVTFTRASTKGDAIWVAATVSDYGGIHAISVTDSQNNTYQELGQENDGQPGSQSVAQFYAGNILGGADTITVHWSADNYKGVIAAEIAGVKGSPLVGSGVAIQDGNLVAGSDNVESSAIAMGNPATASFIVALTMDTDGGGSDLGGSGYCAVPPGSGFKQVTQVWNWAVAGQSPCNLATLETKTVIGGAAAGSFTTTHLSDPYVTVSAAFQ